MCLCVSPFGAAIALRGSQPFMKPFRNAADEKSGVTLGVRLWVSPFGIASAVCGGQTLVVAIQNHGFFFRRGSIPVLHAA